MGNTHFIRTIGDAVQVFSHLLEGMSIRATSRVTGIDKDTISAMLLTMGARAASMFDEKVRDLKSRRIQADEMWAYCHAKRGDVPSAVETQRRLG